MYVCDTCEKSFTRKRNLKRNVTEKHLFPKHWCCPEPDCDAKSLRRYYDLTHLEADEALEKAVNVQSSLQEMSCEDINSDDDTMIELLSEIQEVKNTGMEDDFVQD